MSLKFGLHGPICNKLVTIGSGNRLQNVRQFVHVPICTFKWVAVTGFKGAQYIFVYDFLYGLRFCDLTCHLEETLWYPRSLIMP